MKKTSAAAGGAVAAKSAAFPANPVSASVHKGLHRKAAQGAVPGHRKPLKQRIAENWQLYLLLLIPVIITIVYKYGPMYGIQIAFRDFKASRGITGSEWVGLEWFEEFFSSPNCGRMIKNTILLSLYSLLWSFPVPIILALALNQLRFHRFKRVVQTVLYAPHFISTMIICGIPWTASTPRTSWTPSTNGASTLRTSWPSRKPPGCVTAASPTTPGTPTRRT